MAKETCDGAREFQSTTGVICRILLDNARRACRRSGRAAFNGHLVFLVSSSLRSPLWKPGTSQLRRENLPRKRRNSFWTTLISKACQLVSGMALYSNHTSSSCASCETIRVMAGRCSGEFSNTSRRSRISCPSSRSRYYIARLCQVQWRRTSLSQRFTTREARWRGGSNR